MQQAGRGGSRKRRDRGEVATAVGDAVAEGPAIGAAAQVGADVATADPAPVAVGEHAANLLTAHLAPLAHLLESDSRLVEGLPGDRRRGVEGGGDLLEAQSGQLPHHQRPALAVGKLVEVADQPPQALAKVRRLGDARAPRRKLGVDLLDGTAASQQLDRLVVGDPVQPRLELHSPLLPR